MDMNLFVLQSQVPDAKLGKLYAGSAVFLVVNAILIALLLAFPENELWLRTICIDATTEGSLQSQCGWLTKSATLGAWRRSRWLRLFGWQVRCSAVIHVGTVI
jgi:hypothetical protein